MSDTSYGLLSGKYDSTKQRAVLLNGDRLRNYQSYTATMRMELLLTGQLVLTDAQFFDGLYFHWLGKDKDELEALKKLMCPFQHSLKSENSLFSVSVKCRPPKEDESDPECKGNPDSDYVATKMFCKQFQFSSMEDDDLMRAVFDLSSDYDEWHWANYGDKEQKKVHSLEQDLSAYINNMQEQLEQVYGPKSSIAMNWKQYTEELTNLFCIPMNKWGFCDGSGRWIAYDFLDGMDQCLNQLLDDNETTITYRKKMEELLETACGPGGMCENPAAKRYFARCRSELNKNIGNRSKITVALDELERLCGHIKREQEHLEAQMDTAEKCLKKFRQLMNDRYNKMLAFQHGCQFLDLCDYPNVFEQIGKRKIQTHSINKPELVKTLVKTLAELSWADFVTQLGEHQRELEAGFYEWMSAYKEFSEDKTENLIEALTQYLEKLTTTLKCSCMDKTELEVEPWNRDGTCNSGMRNIFAKSYLSPYYLVGGGSFEASSNGNEICLLCVEQSNDNMTIIRLRIDSSESKDDYSLDTLLAPVFNPLNGGALQHVREVEKKKSDLGAAWNKYLTLLCERSESFVNTGPLQIVTDPIEVQNFQRTHQPVKIGVVYESPYHNLVVDLVRKETGSPFAYERVLQTVPKGAVVIVPRYNGKFLLLKQYRHALRDYQYAFPRGFGEKNLKAEDNVVKEMKEELSAEISNIVSLGTCVADSGLCGDSASVFSCEVDNYTVNTGYEGIAEVIQLSDQEMIQWIKSGKLNDGFTLSAYSLFISYK